MDLCFSGWIQGVDISTVELTEISTGKVFHPLVDGKKITFSTPLDPIDPLGLLNGMEYSEEEVIAKLQSGEWAVSLSQLLNDANYDEDSIEIFDFEAD